MVDNIRPHVEMDDLVYHYSGKPPYLLQVANDTDSTWINARLIQFVSEHGAHGVRVQAA